MEREKRDLLSGLPSGCGICKISDHWQIKLNIGRCFLHLLENLLKGQMSF